MRSFDSPTGKQMQTEDYFKLIVEEIHTTVVATTDGDGLPVTCAVDMMDYDRTGLYFLTAKRKNFYRRLKRNGYIALTGIRGEDTMSRAAVSVRGKVRELGGEKVKELFAKNRYMYEIYPDESMFRELGAFQLYAGTGDWFDLSVKPIGTAHFSFGEEKE